MPWNKFSKVSSTVLVNSEFRSTLTFWEFLPARGAGTGPPHDSFFHVIVCKSSEKIQYVTHVEKKGPKKRILHVWKQTCQREPPHDSFFHVIVCELPPKKICHTCKKGPKKKNPTRVKTDISKRAATLFFFPRHRLQVVAETHVKYVKQESVLQCVTVCCSVLQCVAVCCSALQCVAVCCVAETHVKYVKQDLLHNTVSFIGLFCKRDL